MILAHIITKNKEQAVEIIEVLLERKLMLHAAVSEKTVYEKGESNCRLKSTKQTLIIGKTKALLFNDINQILKTYFPKNMPMLYAVPIVYMDEELAIVLRNNTAKV